MESRAERPAREKKSGVDITINLLLVKQIQAIKTVPANELL